MLMPIMAHYKGKLMTLPSKLTWIDIETTGLTPHLDVILEVGFVVTDHGLVPEAHESWVISHPTMPEMDPFVVKMHTENGLLSEIAAVDPKQSYRMTDANNLMMAWLREHAAPNSPMCGSSVHFDRAFMKVHFPEVEEFFHYRNLDISTLKIVHELWGADLNPPSPRKEHRVISDIRDTLEEALAYNAAWFNESRLGKGRW